MIGAKLLGRLLECLPDAYGDAYGDACCDSSSISLHGNGKILRGMA